MTRAVLTPPEQRRGTTSSGSWNGKSKAQNQKGVRNKQSRMEQRQGCQRWLRQWQPVITSTSTEVRNAGRRMESCKRNGHQTTQSKASEGEPQPPQL